MTDQTRKPKPPAAPAYASSPCSMHEFAADFGLAADDGDDVAKAGAPPASAPAQPASPAARPDADAGSDDARDDGARDAD
jgi:hypothetical protein